MSSLHNRTRPKTYKSWLTSCDEEISQSTLRSRASSEQRRQQRDEFQDGSHDSPASASTSENEGVSYFKNEMVPHYHQCQFAIGILQIHVMLFSTKCLEVGNRTCSVKIICREPVI